MFKFFEILDLIDGLIRRKATGKPSVSGLWFSVPASGFSNALVAEICGGSGAGCSPVEVQLYG